MGRMILMLGLAGALAVGLWPLPMAVAQEAPREQLAAYLLYGNAFRQFPAGPLKHNIAMGLEYGWKQWGVGLEFGLHTGAEDLVPGCNSELGTPCYDPDDQQCASCEFSLTANGSYFIPLPEPMARWEPFLTAGYSVASRSSSAFKRHYPNFGGGLHYWITPGGGFRLEVRDHLAVGGGTVHMPEIRFGIIGRF